MAEGNYAELERPTRSGQRPLLRGLLAIDGLAEGRRMRLGLLLGTVQGVVAPLLDSTLRGTERLSTTARAVDNAQMGGFDGVSVLAIIAVTILGGGMLLGRVAAFVAPDEDSDAPAPLGAGVRSLLRMVRTEWRILRRRSSVEQVLGGGFLIFVSLQTVKAVLSLFRWFTWETVVTWFGLKDTAFGHAVEAVYWFEGGLALLAAATLVGVTLFLAVWALRKETGSISEGRVRDMRFLRAEHPLMLAGGDSSELAGAFHGDLVARLLTDLKSWNPPADAWWESDLRDSLHEYLAERDYRVQPEHSLRVVRRRIDLVVDGCVAIEIKWKLRLASEKDRARSQVVDYARAWTERGPVIVLVVATDRPHVDRIAEEAVRWNKEFESPTAPILVLSHNRANAVEV